MGLGVGLLFIRLSSVLCLIVIQIRGGERGCFSRAGLCLNKILYMLPSRMDGFGVDNFLFSESADMFLLTRGSDKKRLLKQETDNVFLR